MQTTVRNFLLAAGFLAVAVLRYWMSWWSAEVPILAGGTSAHNENAHATIVMFQIFTLAWYFAWARHETQSSYRAIFSP